MPSDVLKLIFTTKKRKKKFWTPKIFGCFGLGVGLGFGCFGFGCWVWVLGVLGVGLGGNTQTQPKHPIFFGFR